MTAMLEDYRRPTSDTDRGDMTSKNGRQPALFRNISGDHALASPLSNHIPQGAWPFKSGRHLNAKEKDASRLETFWPAES